MSQRERDLETKTKYTKIAGLRDTSLTAFVRGRVYETDPNHVAEIGGHDGYSLYVDDLIEALNYSREQAGNMSVFRRRMTRTTASLLSVMEDKDETGELRYADLVAAKNLSFVIPALPQDYARSTVMGSLEYLAKRWVERPPFEEPLVVEALGATIDLTDALNSLRKPGDPIDFQLELWRDPKNRPFWSVGFVGVAISSLVEAVKILPQAVERAQSTDWNSNDALWAFHNLYLKDTNHFIRETACRLHDLSRGKYGEHPADTKEFLAGLGDFLRKAGVSGERVNELENRFYVDGMTWGGDWAEYRSRREKLYPDPLRVPFSA